MTTCLNCGRPNETGELICHVCVGFAHKHLADSTTPREKTDEALQAAARQVIDLCGYMP